MKAHEIKMEFLKQTISEFSRNRCATLAAGLAYYTAFSLPPLLYLLLTILTFGLSVGYDSEQAKNKAEGLLKSQASQMIGNPTASDQIEKILESSEKDSGKWWKSLLSFAGILVGATGVVAALQASLNQVWGVMPDPEYSSIKTVLKKRVLSLAMILGLGFLLVVSLVVSSVLAGLGERVGEFIGMSSAAANGINFLVQTIVILIIFGAIFKIMPDAEVEWKDAAIGAAITTALFLIGRYVMQWYFSYSAPGAHLGAAAASFAVLLVWVYYTAMIVLLGGQATRVYAELYGAGVRPEKHAVIVEQTIKRPE